MLSIKTSTATTAVSTRYNDDTPATSMNPIEEDYRVTFEQFISDPARIQPNYLYYLLQVPPNASQKMIRRNFKRLSMRFHPDQQSPLASNESRFMMAQIHRALVDAYDVLADPQKRSKYDLIQQMRLGSQL